MQDNSEDADHEEWLRVLLHVFLDAECQDNVDHQKHEEDSEPHMDTDLASLDEADLVLMVQCVENDVLDCVSYECQADVLLRDYEIGNE